MKSIKTILLITILILMAVSAFSADEKTLFGGDLREMEHGFYGAVDNRIGMIDDEMAVLNGWRFAWVIDHTFAIGYANMDIVNEIEVEEYKELELNYSGFFFEYIDSYEKLVHFTGRFFAGWGDAGIYRYSGGDNSDDVTDSKLFIIEPNATAEINLFKWMRLNVGGGYRYVGDVDIPGYTSTDLSGINGEISLKFGWKM